MNKTLAQRRAAAQAALDKLRARYAEGQAWSRDDAAKSIDLAVELAYLNERQMSFADAEAWAEQFIKQNAKDEDVVKWAYRFVGRAESLPRGPKPAADHPIDPEYDKVIRSAAKRLGLVDSKVDAKTLARLQQFVCGVYSNRHLDAPPQQRLLPALRRLLKDKGS